MSASLPLVSILVPIYNHSDYILECLNSIANVEYDNIEVLLCDDGSTDHSYLIAQKWVQDHPEIQVLLFKQDNMGVCKTLNRLIKSANGYYVTLCASDDSLISDGITKRIEILESHSEFDAVVGDAHLIDQDSDLLNKSAMKSLYKADFKLLSEDIASELILKWSIVGPTLLIKKETYNNLGLYDEKLLVEDRDFYLRLLENDSLFFYPKPVACYRVHTGNASRGSIAARLNVIHQVAISNVKHYKNFTGINRLFLKSHFIDLLLLKCGGKKSSFFLLYIYRSARYTITTLIRKYKVIKGRI